MRKYLPLFVRHLAPLAGKWQVYANIGRDYMRLESGWRIVGFGILKINIVPKIGAMLEKKDYNGFLIQYRVWFPIERIR
jgi:ABC-type antimicrobial peptide transport system permease subunit